MAKPRAPKREVGPHPRSGKTITRLSSAELQSQLVTDALMGYPTPLDWFTGACLRMAELDRIEVDDAYQRVRSEVASLGGFMPHAPGQ
jgi:hypothetical protein